jgi:hypothetical protein
MNRISVPGLIPKRRRIRAGTTSCPFELTVEVSNDVSFMEGSLTYFEK